MTYTHRNGETEAPTRTGLYWFAGLADGRTMRRITEVQADSGETLAWNDICRSFREIEEFVGEWWGPLVPPWEEER